MLLDVKNLSGGYKNTRILHRISFSMPKGEILCLLGPNGSGKTTLLKALMGFLPQSSGQVFLDGNSLDSLSAPERAKLVAYIPQAHLPIFDYLVYEMVLMGRSCYLGPFDQPSQLDQDIAFAALEQMGIQALAQKKYMKLSGGQRQLVLIARALCQQAKLLIMDEPSSDLDFANQQLIAQTLQQLKNENYSIILSTHAPDFPFNIGDKVILLQQGRLLGHGTPEEILKPSTLKQLYGVAMDVVEVCDSTGHSRKLCLPLQNN